MEAADAMALARSALILAMTVAGPMLIAALIVGVVVGLVQTLTQIQEMTLTFVPKLIAIGIVFLLSLPMIGHAMADFMMRLSTMIVRG